MPFDRFLLMLSIRFPQFNFRHLLWHLLWVVFTLLIDFPPILTLGSSVIFAIWLRDPTIMYSALETFNVNLFATSQMLIFVKSALSFIWIWSGLFPVTVTFVSSENIIGIEQSRQFGRSLIYNKNKSGSRFDPWGTPHLICLLVEVTLLTLQDCLRRLMYDVNVPF